MAHSSTYFQIGNSAFMNFKDDSTTRLTAIPGVLGTLPKPFDFELLEARVLECLAARPAAVEPVATEGTIEHEDDSPKPMSEAQARRFKHSARFGNYLLYPYAQGKKIRYIDTVPIEGKICHQIQVKLDTGYQVDYYIDIRTYLEIKVVNQDLESGKTSSIVYDDYMREFGMPIAKEIQSYEDSEWISALTIDEVKVNSGIIPWMFEMRKY